MQAVESPLLWSDEELADLLQVSSVFDGVCVCVCAVCGATVTPTITHLTRRWNHPVEPTNLCNQQGSPVVTAVRQRLAGIEKEYNELDTVWWQAGSLFNK